MTHQPKNQAPLSRRDVLRVGSLTGLGLTGRDGVWVLAGLVPAGLAVWLIARLLGG